MSYNMVYVAADEGLFIASTAARSECLDQSSNPRYAPLLLLSLDESIVVHCVDSVTCVSQVTNTAKRNTGI